MNDKAYSELIKISAEIVSCKNMPLTDYSDWEWPKGMQKTSWSKVSSSASIAERQCKSWAIRIRGIADCLKSTKE